MTVLTFEYSINKMCQLQYSHYHDDVVNFIEYNIICEVQGPVYNMIYVDLIKKQTSIQIIRGKYYKIINHPPEKTKKILRQLGQLISNLRFRDTYKYPCTLIPCKTAKLIYEKLGLPVLQEICNAMRDILYECDL